VAVVSRVLLDQVDEHLTQDVTLGADDLEVGSGVDVRRT